MLYFEIAVLGSNYHTCYISQVVIIIIIIIIIIIMFLKG